MTFMPLNEKTSKSFLEKRLRNTVRSISLTMPAAHKIGLDLFRMHQRTIRRSRIDGIADHGWEERRMKLDVYENLLRINAGFDQAIRSIAALRKHRAFHRREL